MTTTNRKLLDRSIRHATFLVRLRNGEATRVARLINDVVPTITSDIESRVNKINGGMSPTDSRVLRMRQMRQSLNDTVRGINLLSSLRSNLGDLALTEASFQASILEQAVPAQIGLTFNEPSAQLLRSMVTSRPFEGQVLREWVHANQRSTVDRTMRAVNLGLTRGESTSQIISRVRGAINVSRSEAQAVARTAVNHVSAQAREMTYEENGDIIKSVQYVATLDDRTSLTCASLDGKVFAIGEGPRPPMHFNCRSTTTPVLKSWEELGIPAKNLTDGQRASMNGEVPDKVTFGPWLREQTNTAQNEILGPARAKLFRDGLKIERFVDDKFRPLSLEQLRQLEGLP